jgi:hypothetical protein
MNINVLIDSIVRQTTILIAQLATAAGMRAPLAHTANQVFVELVRELKQQGLPNKVIADMFGLALRTYHSKVRRLAESSTYAGRSLWEAMLEYIQDKQLVRRSDVLRRFRNDDDASVRGVLHDLVESGMVFQSGRGDAITYRAASAEDYSLGDRPQPEEGLANLVWVAVNRYAPAGPAELAEAVPIGRDAVERALERLVADGRITRSEQEGGARYECASCVIPLGAPAGWEAGVFDHFQALVTAVCTKLRAGNTMAHKNDWIGGSTYGFDVWPGHPLRDEVLGFLANVRRQAVSLRERVEAHNREHESVAHCTERVIAYVGQTVLSSDDLTELSEE